MDDTKLNAICHEPDCSKLIARRKELICGALTSGHGCGLSMCIWHMHTQGAYGLCSPCAINERLSGDKSLFVALYEPKELPWTGGRRYTPMQAFLMSTSVTVLIVVIIVAVLMTFNYLTVNI